MQTSTLSWYIARAAGLTAWSLASAAVLWGLHHLIQGLCVRTPAAARMDPRPHRYLGGLATVFTLVHVVAVLADPWLHLSVISAVIPFASSWRPGAIVLGIAGLYLLLAVELTSLARARLPRRLWRAVHFASFPLFLSATVHAFTAGSDTSSLLFVVAATAVILAITGLTGWRIRQATTAPPVRPTQRLRPSPTPTPAAELSRSATPLASPLAPPFASTEKEEILL